MFRTPWTLFKVHLTTTPRLPLSWNKPFDFISIKSTSVSQIKDEEDWNIMEASFLHRQSKTSLKCNFIFVQFML